MAELEWGFCHSLPDLAAKLGILLSPMEPTSTMSQSKKVLSWQTQTTCVALSAFFAFKHDSLSLLKAVFVRCRTQAAVLDPAHKFICTNSAKVLKPSKFAGRVEGKIMPLPPAPFIPA